MEVPVATLMRTDEDPSDTSQDCSPSSANSSANSSIAMEPESPDVITTPSHNPAVDAAMADVLRSMARLRISPLKFRSLPRLKLPTLAYSPKVVHALKLREARLRRQRGVGVVGGPATVVTIAPPAREVERVSGPTTLGATALPARDVEVAPVPDASQEKGETEKIPNSDGSRKRCRMGEDEDCGSAGSVQIRVEPSLEPPSTRLRIAESSCVRPGSARTRSAHNPTIAWALEQRRKRNLRGSSQVVRPVEGLPDSPSNFWDRANLRSVSTAVVHTIRARADWIALSSRSSASREVVLKPGTKRGVEGVEDSEEPSKKRRRRW
jgi:hypothetical protein